MFSRGIYPPYPLLFDTFFKSVRRQIIFFRQYIKCRTPRALGEFTKKRIFVLLATNHLNGVSEIGLKVI